MDSERRSSFGSKESIDGQRRNSKDNTEYVPTRCRITKPTPPKPAANPMQFVKIGPCELFRKAQQQLKKVEEVKHVRQEIRDDAEDWQANLDNWKSSRRKRQEHIIERVVEVKKFEQQEQTGGRRKSKTFNEILEERNKRKTKLSISLYENDDPNDFSDYGIGMTSASNENEMNKIDDNSNVEYDEQNSSTSYETSSSYERDNNTVQDMNERIDNIKLTTTEVLQDSSGTESGSEITTTKNTEIKQQPQQQENKVIEKNAIKENNTWNETYKQEFDTIQPEPEQYTYESAIQGYRTRVISKANVNSLMLPSYGPETKLETKPDEVIVSKGSILKRKELFENDKYYELNHFESSTSRRLSDDFVHSQSLKQRLLSLEKFTEQPLINADNNRFCLENSSILRPVVTNENASDIKNNNTSKLSADQFVRNRVSMLNNRRESIPVEYEDNIKSKSVILSNWSDKNTGSERFSSPEPDVFLNQLDTMHHRSLDNLTDTTNESMPLDRVQSLEGLDYCHSNYPASNSSTELLVLSQYGDTDREDSGIHTADVSCSVSQADEPVEDPDITATVVNSCVEKSCIIPEDIQVNTCVSSQSGEDSSVDGSIQLMSPISTENIDYINSNIYPMDFNFATEEFPLGPPVTALEPPKEKPPPPPVNDAEPDESELIRLNSTKRIKKEMRMKRSSFLGIDPDDQPELEASIRKPPDINSFLQKESRLEKQLYKKTQSSYSEAGDSQDSGIELERGRLSSDTWCSSLADSAGAVGIVHSRQNSEPCTTNSITSEEDEITKKEREIIELVEKEEKWRDTNEFIPADNFDKIDQIQTQNNQNVVVLPKIPPEPVNHQAVAEYATSEDDEHSEVLRVEYELLQLEREELKRQRENMVFRESRARLQTKPCLKNKRLSLEDLNDTSNQPLTYTNMYQPDAMDYRKSMPELQIQREIVPIPTYNPRTQSSTILSRSTHVTPVKHPRPPARETYDNTPIRKSNNAVVEDEMYQRTNATTTKVSHPATRHSLQMLSAAPRSRLIPQDNWIHPKPSTESREKFNYNQHWLIQEAEQRRLSEQQKFTTPPSVQSWKLTRSEKHLPDSVIQTLTQRVQNKINLSERNILGRRLDGVPSHYGSHSPHSVGHALPIHHPHLMMEESQDKMLSVSGKKKCSYCGNELGRGAAMIIESLSLFYHMDCFKCCVCHVQLGDGLMGTDVRVRNNKLHCHNCYSSDDGVKFSCV